MTKLIALRRYEKEREAEWNSFATRARNANFLFNRAYMDYHASRFVDHSLLFYRGNRLIGLLPANESNGSLVSHEGLTFGGILVDASFCLNDALEIFAALVEYARQNSLKRLIYRPSPHCYHAVPTEEDIIAIHRLGGIATEVKPTSVARLDATRAVRPSRPSEVRRASRRGIGVDFDSDFAAFMSICATNLANRYGARPVHTATEITMLAERFPDNISLIAARRQGVVIGGVILFKNRLCARLQYIGVSEEYRHSGALSALQNFAVEQSIIERRQWIDFGPSVEPATGAINLGMVFAKECYGARTLAQTTYALSFD